MQVYGIDALVRITSHFAFIYLAFWSLNAIRLDTFFKAYKTPQIRVAMLLIAVVIGYGASSCFLEILQLFKNFFLSFANL